MADPDDPGSGDPSGVGPQRRSRRALSGVWWSGLGYGAQGASQLVLLAVLGRLLTPTDFGVVTATLVIINLGRLCTQGVIAAALVQRPTLTDGHVRAAFALALGTGLVAAGAVLAAAPLAASFFSMPRLEDVVRALSVLFVIQAFGIVAQGLLERDLRFREVATAEGTGYTVGLAGAGVLAGLLGAGIWSLVIGYLGLALVQSTAMVAFRRHPVLPRFRWGELGELVFFGGGLLGGRFFNYLALQGDNLVVARTLTADALGAYGRAYQLVAMPAMLIGQVLDRVLYPLFSRIQEQRHQLAIDYGRGVSLVLAMAAPVSVVVAVSADEVVRVVLGSGWDQVVWPLRVLGAGLVARTAYKVSDTLSRAVGAVYARAVRQMAYATFVVVGALAGQVWGITGVAVGVTAAIVANHLVMGQLCLRAVPLGWAAFLRVHLRVGLLVAVLAPVAWGVRVVLVGAAPALVVLVAVGAATLVTTAVLTWVVPLRATAELRWLHGEVRSWIWGRTPARTGSQA